MRSLSFIATHRLSSGIFAGKTLEEMHKDLFLLVLSFQGIDEVLEQEVRAQYFYRPEYMLEHVCYKDMVRVHNWGAEMDLNELSSIIKEDKEAPVESIVQQIESKALLENS